MRNPKSNSTFPQEAATANADGQMTIPVVQEHIHVDQVVTESVAARVKIRTSHQEQAITETLRTERLIVERVPIDRIVATAPETRMEDNVMIISVVEEVLVRQYRIVEEVRITTHTDLAESEETVVLRRQDVIVEEYPDDKPISPESQG